MIAILYMAVSIGNALTNVHAEESTLTNGADKSFTVSSDRTITVAISTESIDLDLTPSAAGEFETSPNPLTITVSTNNPTGYNLNMTTTTTNLTRTAPLSGQTPVIQTLSSSGSFTADNFETNAWGFSLDGTNFEAISLSRQINQTIKEANSSTTDLTFGVKLNNEIPSGSYNTTLTFIATTNPLESNFDTAFDAAGKTQVSYNGQNYYKMQDMSGFICSMVATPTDTTSAESTQLIDTRDNSVYWVSKLLDGNCWMTQNLDFDIVGPMTSDTTNLIAYGDAPYNSAGGYSRDVTTNIITWTPEASGRTLATSRELTGQNGEANAGVNLNAVNMWINSSSEPRSVDIGEWYETGTYFKSAEVCAAFGWNANCNVLNRGITTTYSGAALNDYFAQSQYDTNTEHGSIGNYYNKTAAIATNSFELTENVDNYFSNSVCPKGWSLPGKYGYSTLNTLYNDSKGNDDVGLVSSPVYLVHPGEFYYITGSNNITVHSLFDFGWLGHYVQNNRAHLRFGSSTVSVPLEWTELGTSIRCLARTDLTIEDAVYMQDVTPEMRQNTAIGTTTTVLDKRDNNEYTIGKLEDGNIWLLDNLRLGGDTEITLTPSDTNVATNFVLPASSTTCFDDSANCDGSGDSSHTGYTVAAINSSNREITDTNGLKYGNYYNFCAASAGTICQQAANSNATYDICPANWRLPTGGANGEYKALYTAYDSVAVDFQTALHAPLSGYFYNGTAFIQGNSCYIWSSTMSNILTQNNMAILTGGVVPSEGHWRFDGFSVRCVLK